MLVRELPKAEAPTCERCQSETRLVTHLMGEGMKDEPTRFTFFAAFECQSCGLIAFVQAGEIST
jgi:hypothetical protein